MDSEIESEIETEGEEKGEEEEEEVEEEKEDEEEEEEFEKMELKEEQERKIAKRPKKPLKGKGSIVPGVVYLSRIPPFMRPRTIRHLLSKYGQLGRVFLQPEDVMIRERRRRFRGNRKRNYTEGWVEFLDKRVAKATALALNNTLIGGKKRYYYHDDTWNLKYLSKFRWTHLTEKIAYEQAVSDQRMRLEVAQVKRESSQYLLNLEKGKEVEAIVERKRKRGQLLNEHTHRRIRQRSVRTTAKSHDKQATPTVSDSLLMKIFPG